ncbi:hypothetical protein DFH07DRAFT_788206 [Mycena maculata]|uniref:Uncharacterized protein n=1 Tax=Mycena maculata TaxID=230809 RepID=A0AAD7P1C1_9AGAR|nr:hypothetical protein DFH07DRAFT_788206 [Mycena maculata]
MPDNSDTDSESDSLWPTIPDPFVESVNVPLESDSPEGGLRISDAIEEIQRVQLLDVDTVIKDTNVHTAISLASTRIVSFLDGAQADSEESHQRLVDFGQLLDLSFLEALFELRKVFHQIAAQSLAAPGSCGAIVCWVDAILFKIGDASITVASGFSLDLTTPLFPGSADVRAEDGLRAASQLPSEWHLVCGVIASDQASPAAKRLALRLSFAAFVLGPRLCRKNSPVRIPYAMVEVLDRCVNQTRATGFSTSRAGDQLAIQERLNFVMIVALFAVADREHRDLSQGSRFRPHSLGCLLNILQNVMHPDDTVSSLRVIVPPDELDPAQVILLRWGETVSWCWETWDDYRVANSESIVFLTSTWLLHSERPFLSGGAESPPNDMSISTGSSIAILRVLHHVVLVLSTTFPSTSPPSVSMDVISGACFNAINSMRHLLSQPKEDERWILSTFCKYLLSTFVLLLAENDEELCVNDYILEALSLLDADTLGGCLMHIQGDKNFRFSARLDERFIRVQKCVSTTLGRESRAQMRQLNFVRAALHFAVILWFSQTRGCLLRQSVSPLLSTIIQLLLQGGGGSLPSKILGHAFVTASSAARNDPSWTDENQESIWQFATTSLISNLGTASSFAHYLTTSDCLCSALYCAEAWRYLGEVLLLILKRHYIGDQEPLALLTCPTVCNALIQLLRADSASTRFMISTPFTLNLCADLKAACEGTGSGEYFVVMKQRLSTIGPRLLDQIVRKSQSEPLETFEHVSMRLMFYRMYGVSHLMFVPDI